MPSTCSESQNLLRRFFSFSHFGAQRIWKERGSEGSMFLLLFLKKKKKKGKYKREWGRIGGKIMCATLAVSSQSGLEQLSFSYNPSLDFFYSPHFQKKIPCCYGESWFEFWWRRPFPIVPIPPHLRLVIVYSICAFEMISTIPSKTNKNYYYFLKSIFIHWNSYFLGKKRNQRGSCTRKKKQNFLF